MPQPNNSLLTSVYRKPTHTDLYLHWDSHHHLSAKFSVIKTLKHRAKTVCSNHHLLKEEEYHLNKALRRCKYPAWALNRVNINQNENKNKQETGKNKNNISSKKPYKVVPYMQVWVKAARTSAENMGLKCISEEATQSEISWYTPRIGTPSYRRVEWSTGTNVEGWTVRKVTIGNQSEHLQKGSENTHLWPSQHHWLWPVSAQLQHNGQGGPEYCQGYQRGNIN